MTKRLVTILVVSVLAAMLLTSFAFARASWDSPRAHEERLKAMRLYSFPAGISAAQAMSEKGDEFDGVPATSIARKTNLGSAGVASVNAGPGIAVDNSYDDWQGGSRGRKVDFWNTADIQFTYNDLPTDQYTTDTRQGYNVYNAAGGVWPRGLGGGCEIQAVGQYGTGISSAVTPKGRVVIVDQEPATSSDSRIYYQSVPTAYSCTWGLGTAVPKALRNWRGNPADTAGALVVPIIDIQIIGADTVTHMATRWISANLTPAPFNEYCLLYYRKLGQSQAGTWTGPVFLDTMYAYVHLASSRVNNKVAVCYQKVTASGYNHAEAEDEVEYYRESTDGGLTWNPRVACHDTVRAVQSLAPWIESQCLYDTDGNLHVLFNAKVIPADPYGTSYTWNLLRNGSNLYHFYAPTATTSLIYDASWPLDLITSDLCGWVGYNFMTTGYFSISECAGRMYVFWSMANDLNNPDVPHDDCGSGNPADATGAFLANCDIWMAVSNDKIGNLWDAPRNITNTYTKDCDSLTGNGICMNEVKAAVSRYGLDSSSFGAISFPDTTLTLGGTRSNDSSLQMFYIEDHMNGQFTAGAIHSPGTLNPLKYTRISCVTPVTSPRLRVSPLTFGYPQFVKYGQSKNHTITVENQGNATLNLTQNEVAESTYVAQNWLTVSAPTLTVPPASSGSFNMTITATPFFTAGTIWSLSGKLKLHNNMPNADSVKIVTITNYLVADTVVGLVWDTVSTTCTKLVVSSNGDMGRLGLGGVNLDYVGDGHAGKTDCFDSTKNTSHDVYLYSGGPMVVKQTGGSTYVFSSALFQGDFATTQAFKNITGSTPTSGTTAGYDSFYSSNMVNRDTTIVLNRTYWAPKQSDSCPFVIARTRYTAKTVAQSNVLLSEIVDFDVPGNGGSDNKSGISSKGFVYQRGTDSTTGQTLACTDSARWGAVALLGYYAKSELAGGACTNHDSPFGTYAQLNDSLFKYDTTSENVEGGYFWNKATATVSTTPYSKDHHSVVNVVKGQTISPTDTFIVYTVVTSVKQGTLTDLENNFTKAKCWYNTHIRGCSCGCCVGTVGNVDCSAGDGVDIGDLTALIDNLFISFSPLCCPAEADMTGDANVDIGDLTKLIDNLFISFSALPACL